MPTKKKSGSAAWTDPDDAPPLTDAFFDRAEIRHGDRIIRRGRPPLPNPKQAVKLRLDAAILEAFKGRGPGWQTRINDALLSTLTAEEINVHSAGRAAPKANKAPVPPRLGDTERSSR